MKRRVFVGASLSALAVFLLSSCEGAPSDEEVILQFSSRRAIFERLLRMTSEEPRTVDGVAPGEVRSPVVDSPNHYGSWWRREPEAYRFMRPDRLRQYTELMARAGVGRIIWWGEPRKVTSVIWADPIPSKIGATKSIIHSTKPEARIYPNLDSTRLKVENNKIVGLMPLSGDWYIEWNS